jgi:glutamyl-tRNA reductase
MSEGTARHLLRAGAAEIFITNRTAQRATELAALFQGTVIPYDEFAHRLSAMDIVIASSGSPECVVTIDMVRRAIESRRNQPMFLIDIAVPRNVAPEVNGIEHAFVYDLDDLQRLAERNLQTRQEVAQQAENIVEEEVARMEARLRERGAAPTILSLQEQFEAIRRDVLDRYRSRLGPLSASQEETLEALTKGIVNKIAHGPISEIRRHVAEQTNDVRAGELIHAVRRIFRLGDR